MTTEVFVFNSTQHITEYTNIHNTTYYTTIKKDSIKDSIYDDICDQPAHVVNTHTAYHFMKRTSWSQHELGVVAFVQAVVDIARPLDGVAFRLRRIQERPQVRHVLGTEASEKSFACRRVHSPHHGPTAVAAELHCRIVVGESRARRTNVI